MNLQDKLQNAKMQALNAPRMNFYVTEKEVKMDYNLFGAKYFYKVYNDNGLFVEDENSKIIERPGKNEAEKEEPKKSKTRIPSKLRNTSDEEIHPDDKQ